MRGFGEVLKAFTKLGLTSFGGPIAHIGYFHDEFVRKRAWLSDETFSDRLALCQFLPGPASSQLGLSIGYERAGAPGALAAWLGFTLPSAALMIAFAYGLNRFGDFSHAPWVHGLKIIAVAVVAHAVVQMGQKSCRGVVRVLIAGLALVINLLTSSPLAQVGSILIGAALGSLLIREKNPSTPSTSARSPSLRVSIACLTIFGLLILLLPPLATHSNSQSLKLVDSFFRPGSLVFGGGHVVLPLLKAEVVDRGWLSPDTFLAGYGAAQALPGPLFTFSAFLGASSLIAPSGFGGGVIALVAIFLPSFLLVFGALPFWEKIKSSPHARTALLGTNAAVVGLLAAALYNPVWINAVFGWRDFAIAAICFSLLQVKRLPPIAVVALGAGLAQALA